MAHLKRRLWPSPTLCGCFLDLTHEWRISEKARAALYEKFDQEHADLWLRHMEEEGHFDEVVTHPMIARTCAAHAHLDADALHAELHAFTCNAHRPDTCGCSLAASFDRRDPSLAMTPVDHPFHTRRCEKHTHLTDHAEHFRTVKAENAAVSSTKTVDG